MLWNYLKIAWKVLLRRKFFTFISLFGISFTLMVLLVAYALFDYTAGPHRPEMRADRLLFITRMQLLHKEDGVSASSMGYAFLDRYVRPLRTAEKVSLSDGYFTGVPAYVGEHTLKLDRKFTDGEFWQVLDFEFVAGRPYTPAEVGRADRVAVVNESTARNYFGTVADAVGRTLEADAVRYRVVGVVRDVPITRVMTYADFWVPLTTTANDLRSPDYLGNYQAIVLARSAAEVPAVQQEYAQIIGRVPVPDPNRYTKVISFAHPLLAALVGQAVNSAGPDGGVGALAAVGLGLAVLFMLLPALNLVNINVSRTLERSSEIGVRKAFGATGATLVGQFLVENIFLTLLGGLLGLVLAAGALALLNGSQFMPYSAFALNGRVFGVALGVAVFFGLLSGVYPAYKMSKLRALQALKGNTGA